MKSRNYRKIEYYLYNYDYIDIKIANMRAQTLDSEYNQNYQKWIKNKSSLLEDQVIKNILMEQRIYKMKKWKKLITKVLEKYKCTNILYYYFIKLKYFDKATSNTIKKELKLNVKEQKDIQTEIVKYIFLVAIKNQMLKRG